MSHRLHANSAEVQRKIAPAATPSGALKNRAHPVMALHRTLGNRHVAQLIQAGRLTPHGTIAGLQPKLVVGAADDQYEQEADRVAQAVMRAPEPNTSNAVQRTAPWHLGGSEVAQTKRRAIKVTPIQERTPQRSTEAATGETESIQAKTGPAPLESFDAAEAVESQIRRSKGGGSPLPDSVRSYMEPRFGVDFGEVRVHTGSDALQMSRAVGALAFTHGSDIYFGAGSSPTISELTAHELTHVVQQTSPRSVAEGGGEATPQAQRLIDCRVPAISRNASLTTGRPVIQRAPPDQKLNPAQEEAEEWRQQVTRAKNSEDSASIVWRTPSGSIVQILEFDTNESLDQYLSGEMTAQALVKADRAMFSPMSVTAKMPEVEPAAVTEVEQDESVAPAPVAPVPEPKSEEATTGPPQWLTDALHSAFKAIRTARLALFKTSRDVQRAVAATYSELKQLKRTARALANRINHSGGGAKVAAKLASANAKIAELEKFLARNAKLIKEANRAVQAEQRAAATALRELKQLFDGHSAREKAGSFVWRNLWKVAGPRVAKLTQLAKGSVAATRFATVVNALSKPWVARSLMGAAALLEGVTGYLNSHNKTTGGKALNAGLAAGGGALVIANPAVAVADVLLPEGYKPSEVYRGGAGAVSGIGEALGTAAMAGDLSQADTRGMQDFHESSLRGEHGRLMQVSSEAGDYWAEEGIVGGLENFGSELIDWIW